MNQMYYQVVLTLYVKQHADFSFLQLKSMLSPSNPIAFLPKFRRNALKTQLKTMISPENVPNCSSSAKISSPKIISGLSSTLDFIF